MPAQTMEVSLSAMVAQLQKIREEQGEEAYNTARRDIAVALITKPNGDKFISQAFPDLDHDELRAQAEADQEALKQAMGGGGDGATPEQMMLNMMRAQIPNLQNQAQFNLFMGAFDGLRAYLNACFGNDAASAAKARVALNQALDMAPKLHEIAEKIQEMPEALRSEASKAFESPPKEFHEYDMQKQLLTELATLNERSALNVWYRDNREKIDQVVDQRLRNELLDSIRRKRNALDAEEAS